MQEQDGPRFGASPPRGHWAAQIPGFAGMAYIAHGFDCLAADAGLSSGLSVLLKHGITTGDARAAEPWQLREWYYRCCEEYSGLSAAASWDVVAVSRGVIGFNSGGTRLRRSYIAGRRTDEYVMPVPARGCSVLR